MTTNTDDTIPYASYTHPQTRPENLYVIGKLFGMTPPDFRQCRVLELGCAGGSNLIPLAATHPNSEFVGIDLSKPQIDAGKEQITTLNLKNISLEALSLTKLSPKKHGTFDYIITHGLLSWVDEKIQDKIFTITKELLNPNGIAYISYNTLPGWNMAKTVRDMMRYHVQRFKDPAAKIAQARTLLTFVKNNTTAKSYYADMLENEIQILKTQPDSYLLHDHLAEHNTPFYFHEFVKKTQASGLKYLSDTNLAHMYLDNFSKETQKALRGVKDMIRIEQYTDFITNRRFRCSLLCHRDVSLNYSLTEESIKDFYITSHLTPDTPVEKIDSSKDTEVSFSGPCAMRTKNKVLTDVLLTLLEENPTPLSLKEIGAKVQKRLKLKTPEPVQAVLNDYVMPLTLKNGFSLHAEKGDFTNTVSSKPKTSALVHYQAKHGSYATTPKHNNIFINDFERLLLQELDGTKSLNDLTAKMVTHIEKGVLNLNKEGTKITDQKEIKKVTKEATEKMLNALAKKALLIA